MYMPTDSQIDAWAGFVALPTMQELLEESRKLRVELVAVRIECHMAREAARELRLRSAMQRSIARSVRPASFVTLET